MNFLLGMTYINKFIQRILPREHKFGAEHLAPVVIYGEGTEVKATSILSHEELMHEQNEHVSIRAVKFNTVLPETESLVLSVSVVS